VIAAITRSRRSADSAFAIPIGPLRRQGA
jgi:hypothetical protein